MRGDGRWSFLEHSLVSLFTDLIYGNLYPVFLPASDAEVPPKIKILGRLVACGRVNI